MRITDSGLDFPLCAVLSSREDSEKISFVHDTLVSILMRIYSRQSKLALKHMPSSFAQNFEVFCGTFCNSLINRVSL